MGLQLFNTTTGEFIRRLLDGMTVFLANFVKALVEGMVQAGLDEQRVAMIAAQVQSACRLRGCCAVCCSQTLMLNPAGMRWTLHTSQAGQAAHACNGHHSLIA